MLEQKLRKRRWRRVITTSCQSGLASGAIVLVVNVSDGFDAQALKATAIGFSAGLVVPLAVMSVLLAAAPRGWHRRLPYPAYLGAVVGLLLVLAMGMYLLVGLALYPEDAFGLTGLVIAVSVGLVLSFVFSAVATVRQFLGPSFASDLLLGRYHRPRDEERVFAFVDLRGSTQLGEQLGHRQFFSLINDFLALVEQCAELYEGSIYKYVGDGAIIVWSVDHAVGAIECLLELRAAVQHHQPRFEQRYDAAVAFTAGLHEGRVLIGEIGDERREIGYLGDTLNTTQRIQSHCKVLDVPFLLSEAVVQRARSLDAETVDAMHLERHEDVILRGRAEPITLLHPATK